MRTPTELDLLHCRLDGISLIEASAGTGKTWNICGLYLRLLLERGLPVQQILVVTFTNAATAELRERIRQRLLDTQRYLQHDAALANDALIAPLAKRLLAQPGHTSATLLAQLELALAAFDEAAIFTIHGFCQRALADTPFTAHMPLHMELLQDDSELVREVVHDFWRQRLAGATLAPGLAAFLTQCNDTPEKWCRLLKRQLGKPLSMVRWPAAIDTAPAASLAALQAPFALARARWQQQREDIVHGVLAVLGQLNGTRYKLQSVQDAAAEWDSLLASPDPAQLLSQPLRKAELLAQQAISKSPKKGFSPPPHPFFAEAQALLDALAQAQRALRLQRLRLLRDLLHEGSTALRARKRARRVVAFDDMLFNLYERLTDGSAPWLAAALKSRFAAALVDEFQDTDPLQFAIFQAIYGAGDAPLFLVGDPKQAIYSFRNADLPTYLQARAGASAEYTLGANQRSSPALIGALNHLFTRNPAAFLLDGLEYRTVTVGAKPRQQFKDHSDQSPTAPLQLWALPGDPVLANGPLAQKKPLAEAVAQATAAEIARLLTAARAGEVLLDQRPLSAGHIAVLVRSHAEGSRMRSALRALQVGCVELSQAGIYQSAEAEELERILCAILEPAREGRVLAAMATELMGTNAPGIAALREDPAALLEALQRFGDLRQRWLQQGIGITLRHWLAGDRVAERLLARPDGERRLTNVLHLFECLHQAEPQHSAADGLLHWFQLQRSDAATDDTTQLRLESDQNLVQIITIHRSKGLEYPVVFCPFLWNGRRNNVSEGLDGVEYHADDAGNVIDFCKDFEGEFEHDAIQDRNQRDSAAELLRLVYVALTRAVHRCYLPVGCYLTPSVKGGSATESTRSLLNWLVAGAGQDAAQWFGHKTAPESIAQAWHALATDSGGTIGLCALPAHAGAPALPRLHSTATLAAQPAPPAPAPGWWIGSYSGLAHGAAHELAARDHDLRPTQAGGQAAIPTPIATSTGEAPPAPLDGPDILHFPRGPVAGECMHQVFEQIDFADPTTWPSAVDTALRELDSAGANAGDGNGQPGMLLRMLQDVLDTELPSGTPVPLRLRDVTLQRRLTELEFHLPAPHLDAHTLNATLHQLGYPVAPLAFTTLRGYLKGFIDLVFEHQGRYFLLDWKSNHLGATQGDYHRAAVDQAMYQHGYHLQHLLYSVALHRYLQQRLPDYQPQQHFGGVLYLFVRGVRPHWRQPDGSPCGVYFHRPAPAVLHTLSDLLTPGASP